MTRRRALAVALIAACTLPGCAELRTRLEASIAPETPQLVFDRPDDLVPPEALRVTSTENRQVALAWDPVLVGDVAGYAITRSRERSGSYEVAGITETRFGTVWIDSGDYPGALGDGQTYYYRIHPFDTQGSVSRSHAFISATTEPPPEAPVGLQLYSNQARRVVLRWVPSPDPSVDGYQVLRGPTSAGPWERVAYVEGRLRNVHVDDVDGDLRVLYYRLQALNRFGGESEMTAAVRGVTKAEPLPPIGLDVSSHELGRVELRWERNVERDVTHYEVVREVEGPEGWSRPSSIAEVAAPATSFIDTGVGCGQRVRYRLRAHDADGLRSPPSDWLQTIGEDIGLDSDGQTLSWDPRRTRHWQTALVYRSRWLRPDAELGQVPAEGPFPLADVPPGRHHMTVVLTRPLESPPPPNGSTLRLGTSSVETAPRCQANVEVARRP